MCVCGEVQVYRRIFTSKCNLLCKLKEEKKKFFNKKNYIQTTAIVNLNPST